jgi:hypothetical protein
MSDEVRIGIDGDRQIGLRFEEFPDHLHDDLRGEIDALSRELFGRIEAQVPSNTGKLRSQVRLRMFDQEDRIRGYIDIAGDKGSTDHAKAGALEYGSRGKPAKVGAHQMKLDHFWRTRLAAPISVLVDAYTRTPNIAEHAFMRGPLDAMRPEILARLNAAVEQAVAAANDGAGA